MKFKTLFRQTALWSAAAISVFFTLIPPVAASAGSVSYGYDNLGRLTNAAYSNGVVITYTYDAAGNRINVSTSGGAALAMPSQSSLLVASASENMIASKTEPALGAGGKRRAVGELHFPIGGEDHAFYGWNNRSVSPQHRVTAAFESDGTQRLLHVQGYAIDAPNAVGLWLNGVLLGYLSESTDGAMSTPSLWLLPAALQLPGENIIEFVPKTKNQIWGVTRLGYYSMGSGLGNQEGLPDGDLSHADGFELNLFSNDALQSDGYLVELAGWDVNRNEEIAFELNEKPMAELLLQSDNRAWGPVAKVLLGSDLLLPGNNRLLISNSYGPLEPWGVCIKRILENYEANNDEANMDESSGQLEQ